MDGLEVIKKAKDRFKKDGFSFPTVIMLTAIEDTRLRYTCLRENYVDHFFTKPAPVEELEAIIKYVMKSVS